MDQQTYDARVKAFMADMRAKDVPPEVAAASLAGMEQADKSAKTALDPLTGEPGVAFKSDDAAPVFTAPDGTPGLIVDGHFIALKAGMAPASMMQAGATEMADATANQAGESPEEDTGEAGEETYVGDMTPDEFRAFLIDAFGEAIQAHGNDITTRMAAVDEAVKGMGYARMKSEEVATANSAEIAKLKARLAELEGSQPAVVQPADIEAALKGAPQAPPDPSQPQLPADASPITRLAAQTMPGLYTTGTNGQWTGWTPPAPLPQS